MVLTYALHFLMHTSQELYSFQDNLVLNNPFNDVPFPLHEINAPKSKMACPEQHC